MNSFFLHLIINPKKWHKYCINIKRIEIHQKMKTIKTNKYLLLIIFSFAIISCEKIDNNQEVTITRNDYIGFWTVTEVPISKTMYFDCEISIDGNSEDKIKIQNFAGLNQIAYVKVNGKSLILPKQTLNGNTIEGVGNYVNKDYITWQYYVKVGNSDSSMYNTNFNRK